LPALDVNEVERDIWAKAKEGLADAQHMHETLEDIRKAGHIQLSDRSIM